MTLWKGPTYNTKLNYGDSPSFNKNPCAPCNSNPDPNAVQVTIQFPRYTYPVFFPSSAPETCSFLLRYIICYIIVTSLLYNSVTKKTLVWYVKDLRNCYPFYQQANYQCR